MAVEDKDKTTGGKDYLFKRCLQCGVKLHVSAYSCWKCGRKAENMVYSSNNPNDAVYNLTVNDVDRCLICRNTQSGNTCKYNYCFGSGRGKCGYCNRFESMRFMCCQEAQGKPRQKQEAR